MRELIKNAWIGWQDYTEAGKLAALLLIALLLFWFAEKKYRNRYPALILYTTVMVVLCICPLTAAVLMTYQTRFYDYQWIWSMVPVTIVIALAGTLLWFELTGEYAKGRNRRWKCAGIAAVMVGVIFLCGPMMQNTWSPEQVTTKQVDTANVLEIITENGQNKDITLWAPKGIMEDVRALDGNVRLPYGRNMWDPALNAYSYDTYGKTENVLYAWMSHAEETGEDEVILENEVLKLPDSMTGYSPADSVVPTMQETTLRETITAIDCMDLAKQLGVTHILLPGNLQPEVLAEIKEYLGIQAETVEDCFLFCIE